MKVKGQEGFSLVELFIVIAIIGIVAAIAIPNLQRYVANTNLKSVARDIAGDFFILKERAISENREYRISFNVGANQYTIEQCNTIGSSCSVFTTIQIKSPAVFVRDVRFAQNITTACYSGASTNFNVSTVIFQTRGTMYPTTGTILLTNNRGSTSTITYNITGKTHVCFNMR